MKNISSVIIFVVLLVGYFMSSAQTIKPLKIGDSIPDIALRKMLFHRNSSAKLSDFNGKAIIIDQWFIGCGPCVSAMPHLDTLQKEFEDDLQIIPVTFEKQKAVEFFWSNNIIVKGIRLPQVVEDNLIQSYFPAISFPQQVWINKNRIVVAITDGNSATRKNIRKFVNGEKLSLFIKNDEMNSQVRLAEKPNIFMRFEENKRKLLYYSYFSKYRPELAGISFTKIDTTDKVVRVISNNNSLVGLYDMAYKGDRFPYGIEMSHQPTRLIRKDLNPVKSKNSNIADTIFLYCYELMYAANTTEEFGKLMIKDLDKFFNLRSHEELMDIQCYVIKPNGKGNRYFEIYQPDRKPYWTISLQVAKRILINNNSRRLAEQRINDLSELPVLLEIEGDRKISLDVRWNPENLKLMNDGLSRFDLMIEKTIRKRKVIVLEDQ